MYRYYYDIVITVSLVYIVLHYRYKASVNGDASGERDRISNSDSNFGVIGPK